MTPFTLADEPPFALALPRDQRPYSGMEVLMYYDGPLLFWLPSPQPQRRLLAVALFDIDGMAWPFLVADMGEAAATDLMENRLTLQAAVLTAPRAYLLRDYGADVLQLERLDAIPEDWLPGDAYLDIDATESVGRSDATRSKSLPLERCVQGAS